MFITLNALAEPNRIHIIELLREKPYSVNQITERLQLSQPLVSKHLRVLSKAGLVDVRPIAQQRIYHLKAQPLKDLDVWLNTFKHRWDDKLDMLDDYLQELKDKESPEN